MGDSSLVLSGDSTIVLELEERIDARVNARAIAIAEAVRARGWPGVRDVVPTFRSVAIAFDPLKADPAWIAAELERIESSIEAPVDDRPPITIPVCYGGQLGPDLEALARWAGCHPDDVVNWHASTTYRVYMLGFVPGFAYMGTVDARIRGPRHATPRVRVPAGSVGIAGAQTGVYPMETPGGWQLIGRTPIPVFEPTREKPFLLRAGDSVRFEPIGLEAFESRVRWSRAGQA
jgi:KipI family sensor histidine kinase inhibitor